MTPECRGGQLRLGRLGRGPPGRSPGPAQDRRICGADRSRHRRLPPLTRAHTSPLSRPDAGTRCAVANVALQTPGSPSSCESPPSRDGASSPAHANAPCTPRRPHVQRPKDGSASRRSPRRAAARRGALDAPGMVPCDTRAGSSEMPWDAPSSAPWLRAAPPQGAHRPSLGGCGCRGGRRRLPSQGPPRGAGTTETRFYSRCPKQPVAASSRGPPGSGL